MSKFDKIKIMNINRFLMLLLLFVFLVNGIDAKTYNVKQFGAKGNGKQDDSNAIQQCIDQAARNGGGIVYFPKGTYIVSRTSTSGKAWCIRSSNNIEFKGEDKNLSIIKLAAKQKNYTRILYLEDVRNIKIRDLTFDGNLNNQLNPIKPNEHLAALFVHQSRNVLITNSNFINTGGDGIHIYGTKMPSKEIVIEKCNFINNQRNGITLDSGFDGIIIRNSYFDASIDDSPIDSEPSGGVCQNVLIENNKIFTPTILTIGGPSDSNTGKSYVIRNNYLENCGFYMVNAENILIEYNTIRGTQPVKNPAFTVIAYNKDINIGNNKIETIDNGFIYAVFTQYTKKAANGIKITGNEINLRGENLNAFHLRGVSDVDINSNRVKTAPGKSNRVLYVYANYPMKGITLKNNTFDGFDKGVETFGSPKNKVSGLRVEYNNFNNSTGGLVPLKVISKQETVEKINFIGNKKNNILHNRY